MRQRMKQIAVRSVPKLDNGVISGAGEECPIRTKRHSGNIAGLPARQRQRSRRLIPILTVPVRPAAGERVPIWIEVQRPSCIGVTAPCVAQNVSTCIPDPYLSPAAGGCPVLPGTAD